MSVTLRHKMFPLIIMYKDPEGEWDKFVKERILKELREDGFDKYTVIDEEAGKTFLEFKVKEKTEAGEKEESKEGKEEEMKAGDLVKISCTCGNAHSEEHLIGVVVREDDNTQQVEVLVKGVHAWITRKGLEVVAVTTGQLGDEK